MEEKELNELLSKVDSTVAEKFKAAIGDFKENFKSEQETKLNDAIEKAITDFKGESTMTPIEFEKALKEQGEALAKFKVNEVVDKSAKAPIKNLIKENFESISKVEKGRAFNTKAVGNMTLSNLTGDQPRDYNMDVVMTPNQLANVSDLVGLVNISGGTYTFPRETGTEGSISTQTEGSAKSQIDYDITMVDVNTDFLAGFAVYSKKMRNNLPFLESFLPKALRRDYMKAENAAFNTVLAANATASSQVITGNTKMGMLINDISAREELDYQVKSIVLRPSDWYDILKTAKDDLEAVVTFEGGVLRINGIPTYKATWLAANKYYLGDWSRVNKIVTEGFSLEFSNEDSDNFRKNNITARVEEQNALAVEQPAAIVYGDFTAT